MPVNSLYPEMRPTPRNRLRGLLADAARGIYDYAQKPDPTMPMGKANPVLSLLADTIPLQAGANVLNDYSYGQAPVRGAGMTTRLTPDATELVLTALPFPKTSAKVAAALGSAGMVPGVDAAALLPGALEKARGLLGEIAQGGKPRPIDIAELTPQQFAELNKARKLYGQPEFAQPTVVYSGKHHFASRSADGDSIDEMLLQIANSLDDTSGVVLSRRGPALQNPQIRINPRGEEVRDRAVLEGGGDRLTWLFSAIPKRKAP
jgi:hypothetical protein